MSKSKGKPYRTDGPSPAERAREAAKIVRAAAFAVAADYRRADEMGDVAVRNQALDQIVAMVGRRDERSADLVIPRAFRRAMGLR